jgi:serine/threonine protein kinase/beta-lactam-binding protein with PASTA domain
MEEYNDKYEKCPYCDYAPNTPAVEAYHMSPGTVLQGKYVVGRVLGYGGFGVTYIGKDTLLEKKVAIKEYLPGEFSTRVPGQTELTIYSDEKNEQFQKGVKKFVEEAKRLAKFQNQEHIVQIFDAFEENNTAYIIMEYLEGETLKDKLERDGNMDVDEALKIIIPLAQALGVVHKAGIIHRDISPDNIFLTKDRDIKLLDFGAARSAIVGRSRSLSVIVKEGYAPTEQYRSKGEQGSWTDVYALAATLYRMITGVVPDDSMERMYSDHLKTPSKMGVNISKGTENAIMNALQISFDQRTQTMERFVEELRGDNTARRHEKKKKADTGRWTLSMKLGVGTAAFALILIGALVGFGVIGNVGVLSGSQQLDYETIPDLTGLDYNEAAVVLEDMGVSMKQAAYSYSDTMAENVVVTQSISQGTKVEEGQTMEVIVSLGKERKVIGDVIGFELNNMTDKLDGFYYVTSEEESELAKGTILSVQDEQGQDVDLSEEIGVGNTLTVVLSKGDFYEETGETTVPNLVNKDFATARKEIKNSKLYIQKAELQSSDTVPKGSVISQDIEEGTSAAVGTIVSVVISSGEIPKIAIPNVLDKTENEATEILEKQKFVVKVTYEESSLVEKGKVIRTSPQVNEEVKEGSEVEIVVSTGVTVRNNTSKSQTTQATSSKSDDSGVNVVPSKDYDTITIGD